MNIIQAGRLECVVTSLSTDHHQKQNIVCVYVCAHVCACVCVCVLITVMYDCNIKHIVYRSSQA